MCVFCLGSHEVCLFVRKIFIIFVILFNISAISQDDEFFEDDIFEDFEYDPDFKDDFYVNYNEGGQNTLSESFLFDAYNERFNKVGFVRNERSLSLLTSQETLGKIYHLSLYPNAHFTNESLYVHLGLPLRFPIYDNVSSDMVGENGNGFMPIKKALLPRKNDFSSIADMARIVRHLEINDESYPHFFRMSKNHTLTFGQGSLLKSFSTGYLHDQHELLARGYGKFDLFDVDAFVAPVPKVNIFGVRSRFSPFTSFSLPDFLKHANVEAAYVADYAAPNKAKTHDGYLKLSDKGRLVAREKGTVQGLTLNALSRYVPRGWLFLTPYVTTGHLLFTGIESSNENSVHYGTGLHIGHDLGINFANEDFSSLLLIRTEARIFSGNYWPSYFDRTYLLDRQVINEDAGTNELSKSQMVIKNAQGWRYGYNVGLKYTFKEIFYASLGYEDALNINNNKRIFNLRKLYFASRLSLLEKVELFVSYEASAIKKLKNIFNMEKSRSFLKVGSEVKLLSYLYFNGYIKHSCGIADAFLHKPKDKDNSIMLSKNGFYKSLNFGLGVELVLNI